MRFLWQTLDMTIMTIPSMIMIPTIQGEGLLLAMKSQKTQAIRKRQSSSLTKQRIYGILFF